jgi:benzyl alcohol O-benzoyltransferase
MATTLPASFTVRRGEPVLVAPAEPTPREAKPLSDLDDGEGMRFYSSGIHLYRANPAKAGQDPARVIRDALARALVPYYPLAGRLREEEGRKLVLQCDARGVMFAEADCDLTADDFGDVQSPPFPCFQQFILESTTVAGVEPVVDRPLLYIQVYITDFFFTLLHHHHHHHHTVFLIIILLFLEKSSALITNEANHATVRC